MNERNWSFLKGAMIAGAGAAAAYVLNAASAGELGQHSALIAMIVSIAINAAKKYLIDED